MNYALAKAGAGRIDEWALGLLRKLKINRVSVPPDFPLAVARRLQRAGIHLAMIADQGFPWTPG